MERQSAMELLDSWIERLLHFLHPDEAPPPCIVPFSLHIPDEVLALLPVPVRESVSARAQRAFNADNMHAEDLSNNDFNESTAYLDGFERSELQWLLVKMDERLTGLEESERQRQQVQHPLMGPEWFGGQLDIALLELATESIVLEEMQVVEEWCEQAGDADENDEEVSLDKFVQLAELLVNKAPADCV